MAFFTSVSSSWGRFWRVSASAVGSVPESAAMYAAAVSFLSAGRKRFVSGIALMEARCSIG